MMHSALTDQVKPTAQQSSRGGVTIDRILLHHQAGTNDDAVIAAMQSGSRQVSANYTVSNEGRITSVVPEELRAWTSGSTTDGGRGAAYDKRSITFEIENESGAPGWPISSAAAERVAALCADLSIRYGIPLDRDHVVGHRELYSDWQRLGLSGPASYATACPGGVPLDWIVSRAQQLITGDNEIGDDRMRIYENAGDGSAGVQFTGEFWACAPGVAIKLNNNDFGGERFVRDVLTASFNKPILRFKGDLDNTVKLWLRMAPPSAAAVDVTKLAAELAGNPEFVKGIAAAVKVPSKISGTLS